MSVPGRLMIAIVIGVLGSSPLQAQLDLDRILGGIDTDLGARVQQALRTGNRDLALEITRTAAEAGSAQAQFVLGAMLTEWHQLHGAARDWFDRAVAQEYADAFYGLGLLYVEGRGVPARPALAHALFLAGARRGQTESMFEIGAGYILGEPHGPPNLPAGLFWLARARASGHPRADALIRLTEAQFGAGCEAVRASVDPALADRNCFDWSAAELARASDQADCDAARVVRGTPRERFRIVKGAEEGRAECGYHLGMSSLAIGDTARGHDWLVIAAARGHAGAAATLAGQYARERLHGETPTETRARSHFWTVVAARAGDPDAQQALSQRGIQRTPEESAVTPENLRRLGYLPLPSYMVGPPLRRLRRVPAPTPSPAAGDVILGTWDQYILTDGQYRRIAQFRVTRARDGYAMALEWLSRDTPLVGVTSVRDIVSDGVDWTFTSEWSDGRAGEFRLRRIEDGLYHGHTWVAGLRGTQNRWVRVGSLP